jgi:hypothetical protein
VVAEVEGVEERFVEQAAGIVGGGGVELVRVVARDEDLA